MNRRATSGRRDVTPGATAPEGSRAATAPEEPTSRPLSWIVDPPRAIWMLAIAGMILLAAAWLSYQSWRYFADPGALGSRQIAEGAIDVHNRYRETQSWFAGEPVYRMYRDAVYPPASYAMLKAAFNVLPWDAVKALWYLLSLASVAALSWQLVQHSLARSRLERAFIGTMPFAFYATGAALGNGQFVTFVLPLVLNAMLLVAGPAASGRTTALAALLMLAGLVQPIIAAPFFWLFLFVRTFRLRAGAAVVAGYLALTAVAVWFQIGAYTLKRDPTVSTPVLEVWTKRAEGGSYHGSLRGGYGTVHDVLAALDLREWNSAASIAILCLLGAWIFRHRKADLWILLGVTAVVARIWTYHRWYDDLLLLLPLVALFRLARLPATGRWTKVAASGLFVWVWGFLLAPGVLYTLPNLGILVDVQVAGWLAALAFLVGVAEFERRAAMRAGDAARAVA